MGLESRRYWEVQKDGLGDKAGDVARSRNVDCFVYYG